MDGNRKEHLALQKSDGDNERVIILGQPPSSQNQANALLWDSTTAEELKEPMPVQKKKHKPSNPKNALRFIHVLLRQVQTAKLYTVSDRHQKASFVCIYTLVVLIISASVLN